MSSSTATTHLQDTFGYPEFRGKQAEIVNTIAQGGNALVLMPTGAGNRCAIKFLH